MAKNSKSAAIACAITLMALTGCHNEDIPGGGTIGKGQLVPGVELNTEVVGSKASARGDGDLTINDLSLTIKSTDGSYSKTWASVADYDGSELFPIGAYTVSAAYGEPTEEGFEKPAYFGSASVTVVENESTSVSLTATLANAMVSVEYTDAFKKYMTSWGAEVHADGGGYLYIGSEETRPLYIRTGDATLSVEFVKPGKTDKVKLQVLSFKAQARHHYHATIDVNNGGVGEAVLNITFDDTVSEETVDIELSDELLNAPAPTVTAADASVPAGGTAMNHVEGTPWNTPLKLNIVARAGLSSVTLTTQSKSLVANQGWPAEINLAAADEAMQQRMKALGFQSVGLFRNPDKMAIIDLTNVIPHIKEASTDNTTTFAVKVVDKYGKASEVYTWTINLEPQVVTISEPSTLYVGQDKLDLTLTYNGANPQENVKFQYFNDRGTWSDLTVVSIAAKTRARSSEKNYAVTLKVSADSDDLRLRAVSGTKASSELTVKREVPAVEASAADKDVWAAKAYVKVVSKDVNALSLAPLITAYVSTDGSTYTAATASVSKDNILLVKGLKAGTAYKLRLSAVADPDKASPDIEFTTENATALPNGDFETLTANVTAKDMLQGGQWSISAGVYYDNKLSYTISEPNGWATVNAKTASTSHKTQNSFFVVPSTFNSTLTWFSTVPNIKVLGTGGGTETPDSYKGFTAQHGKNAMVLRNVAWDPEGKRPDKWKKEFAGTDEYYGHNVPEVSQRSAGKLFLGTYTYNNGSETYNQGVAFASRPTSLKGYYTYTNDPGDTAEKGKVTVQVLSGETIIGSGSVTLGAVAKYTAFNVPVTYQANVGKATSIRVMITSSTHASDNQAAETAAIKVSTFNSRYESAMHGATLCVDNLSLAY